MFQDLCHVKTTDKMTTQYEGVITILLLFLKNEL